MGLFGSKKKIYYSTSVVPLGNGTTPRPFIRSVMARKTKRPDASFGEILTGDIIAGNGKKLLRFMNWSRHNIWGRDVLSPNLIYPEGEYQQKIHDWLMSKNYDPFFAQFPIPAKAKTNVDKFIWILGSNYPARAIKWNYFYDNAQQLFSDYPHECGLHTRFYRGRGSNTCPWLRDAYGSSAWRGHHTFTYFYTAAGEWAGYFVACLWSAMEELTNCVFTTRGSRGGFFHTGAHRTNFHDYTFTSFFQNRKRYEPGYESRPGEFGSGGSYQELMGFDSTTITAQIQISEDTVQGVLPSILKEDGVISNNQRVKVTAYSVLHRPTPYSRAMVHYSTALKDKPFEDIPTFNFTTGSRTISETVDLFYREDCSGMGTGYSCSSVPMARHTGIIIGYADDGSPIMGVEPYEYEREWVSWGANSNSGPVYSSPHPTRTTQVPETFVNGISLGIFDPKLWEPEKALYVEYTLMTPTETTTSREVVDEDATANAREKARQDNPNITDEEVSAIVIYKTVTSDEVKMTRVKRAFMRPLAQLDKWASYLFPFGRRVPRGFIPPIPIKANWSFMISPTEKYKGTHKHLKDIKDPAEQRTWLIHKAVKKAMGKAKQANDIAKAIYESPSNGELAHAYVVFGVPISTLNQGGLSYLYEFFRTQLLGSQTYGESISSKLREDIDFVHKKYKLTFDVMNVSLGKFLEEFKKLDQNDPVVARLVQYIKTIKGASFSDLVINVIQNPEVSWTNSIEVKGTSLTQYGIRITWDGMFSGRSEGTFGNLRPGQIITIYGNSAFKELYNFPINDNNTFCFVRQMIGFYEVLVIRALKMSNNISNGGGNYFDGISEMVKYTSDYKSKSEIKKLRDKWKESGRPINIADNYTFYTEPPKTPFILPFHIDVARSQGLYHFTDTARLVPYILCNTYKIVKIRWYQQGIFKVIIMVIVAIIAVICAIFTGGTSLGLIGAAAAALAGTTVGMAFYVAVFIVMMIVQAVMQVLLPVALKVMVSIFGKQLGTILHYVGVVILSMFIGGGFSNFSSALQASIQSPLFWINAASTGVSTYAQYIADIAKKTAMDTLSMIAQYQNRIDQVEDFKKLLNFDRSINAEIRDAILDSSIHLVEDPPLYIADTRTSNLALFFASVDRLADTCVTNFTSDRLALNLPKGSIE